MASASTLVLFARLIFSLAVVIGLMWVAANVLAETDVLVLTEVYPAGETPIPNADGRALARAVRARGKVDPVLIEHPRELKQALPPLLRNGDLLLLLGAGDIGAAANEIAAGKQLRSAA